MTPQPSKLSSAAAKHRDMNLALHPIRIANARELKRHEQDVHDETSTHRHPESVLLVMMQPLTGGGSGEAIVRAMFPSTSLIA